MMKREVAGEVSAVVRQFSGVLGVALALLGSQQAFALDLNGTSWVGTFDCKGFDAAGRRLLFKTGVTMSISQTGTAATAGADFGNGPVVYDATVYGDAKNPASKGFIGLVFPGNGTESSSFNELVWGTVTYNAQTGKGRLTLTGERVSADPNGFDTCKWKFKTP